MAFSSGDSFTKLPPIKREEEPDDKHDGENPDKQTSTAHLPGLNRKKHGLVRLPPIVHLDSFQSLVNKTPSREADELPFSGQLTVDYAGQQDETFGQTNCFRTESSPSFAYSSFKNESDEDKKPARVKNGSEDEIFVADALKTASKENTDLNYVSGRGVKSALRKLKLRKDEAHYMQLHDSGNDNNINRPSKQLELSDATTKLHRGRKFAKFSPNLAKSNTKSPVIKCKSLTSQQTDCEGPQLTTNGVSCETEKRRNYASGFMKGVVSLSEPKNSLESHKNANFIEQLSNGRLVTRGRKLGQQNRIISDAKSTPTSPVFNGGTSKETVHETRARGSLDSATELLITVPSRKSSLAPPQAQNFIKTEESKKLCVKGKSFAPSERANQSRISGIETGLRRNTRAANSSHVEQPSGKRASVYNLEQILSILNTEESSKSPNSNSPEFYGSSSSNARDSRAASIYNLNEFLLLHSPAKSPDPPPNRSPLSPSNSFLSVEPSTSSDQHEDSRRLSAYNLFEFLQLHSPGSSQRASRSVTPTDAEPGQTTPKSSSVPSVNVLKIPRQESDSESRRSSMYDLIEFLSLNRQVPNSNCKQNDSKGSFSNNASDKQSTKLSLPETADSKSVRSASVYDLKEFLTMNSSQPQSQTHKESEGNKSSAVSPNTSDKGHGTSVHNHTEFARDITEVRPPNQHKTTKMRGNTHATSHENLQDSSTKNERSASIYDLREFLSLKSAIPTERVEKTSLGESGIGSKISRKKAALLTPEGVLSHGAEAKRGSVYNLHEFLQVLQDEANKSNDSAPNLETYPSPAHSKATKEDRPDSRTSSGYSTASADSPTNGTQPSARGPLQTLQPSLSQVSPDDLIDLLGTMHAPQIALGRKPSSISLLSGAGSLDGPDDVFLCVPGTDRKRSSVYDLNEFLNLLNTEESPLRRRLSSVLSRKQSEDNLPVTPEPLSRHDSGGVKSLYDLSEFLSVLNKDDSPLRRRLSSASSSTGGDRSGDQTPLQHQDSGELTFYSLDEILTALNDIASKESESSQDDAQTDEISIPVPNLAYSKNVAEKRDSGTTRTPLRKRISGSSRALKSVPECREVKASDSKRFSF